ncbi:hypothetical protein ABZ470_37865 [Streptosporangium sp. NPDC020072]|uniref:hypothetical protein n=1 Tax=unclassified Streptosporangium TaxID=2632669 RepID=UPI003442176B
MDRRHRPSPALLAALALSGVAFLPATTASAQVTPPGDKPPAYQQAYEKGYADSAHMCDKAASFSYEESDSWDRKGWVDGYNAGHAAQC